MKKARTSKRLHHQLVHGIPIGPVPRGLRRPFHGIPTVRNLVDDGHDPVHAAYVVTQNISSCFAENCSGLPVLAKYAKIVERAIEVYMPGSPPLSPLTHSYFTTWAFYDLRFDGHDTIADCQIEAADWTGMSPEQLQSLRNLAASRMGIYEQVECSGVTVRLAELMSGETFTVQSITGYSGRQGEIWYVRLLPPLEPAANNHIVFTTPYILLAPKEDWVQYLRRTMLKVTGGDDRERLCRLLKNGLGTNYWNEFVFQAYHHHQSDAIFLAGIPDLKATLPHA
jgi:hypothetical protein